MKDQSELLGRIEERFGEKLINVQHMLEKIQTPHEQESNTEQITKELDDLKNQVVDFASSNNIKKEEYAKLIDILNNKEKKILELQDEKDQNYDKVYNNLYKTIQRYLAQDKTWAQNNSDYIADFVKTRNMRGHTSNLIDQLYADEQRRNQLVNYMKNIMQYIDENQQVDIIKLDKGLLDFGCANGIFSKEGKLTFLGRKYHRIAQSS